MGAIAIEERVGENGTQWVAVAGGVEFLSADRVLIEDALRSYEAAVPCAGGPAQFEHVLVVRKLVGRRAQMRTSGALDSVGWGIVVLTDEAGDAPHEVGHLWAYGGPSALTEGRAQVLARCVALRIDAPLYYPDFGLLPSMPDLETWQTTQDEDPDPLELAGYAGAYALVQAIDATGGYSWPLDGKVSWKSVSAALADSLRPDARALGAAMEGWGAGLVDVLADPDHDGVPSVTEGAHGTDPARWDSDGDGLPDGDEPIPGALRMSSGRVLCFDDDEEPHDFVRGRSAYGASLHVWLDAPYPKFVGVGGDDPYVVGWLTNARVSDGCDQDDHVVIAIREPAAGLGTASRLRLAVDAQRDRAGRVLGPALAPTRVIAVLGRGSAMVPEAVVVPFASYESVESDAQVALLAADIVARVVLGPGYASDAMWRDRIIRAMEAGEVDAELTTALRRLLMPGAVRLTVKGTVPGLDGLDFRDQIEQALVGARGSLGADLMPEGLVVELGGYSRADVHNHVVQLGSAECGSLSNLDSQRFLAAKIVAMAVLHSKDDQRWTEALARDLSGVNGGSWPEEEDVEAIRASVAARGGWSVALAEPISP